MHSVVTVLEEPHLGQVYQLWAEMNRLFGVGAPEATAVPHFSYHVAPTYELEKLRTVLLETAVSTPPFTVKTTGIGIFPGDLPVLYLPVARSPQLQALHTTLWPQLQAVAHASLDYYAPQNWFPHITLGHNDITPDQLGPIVTWLNRQPLAWDVLVTNLTLLYDTGERHVPLHQAVLS
ncbi:MAG: 2'-5' RNA ligase family protein [Anaerolineaceae bacterium]|nr:2'-5' RNA ligase family protein [Anaerolineaceae bacterium]